MPLKHFPLLLLLALVGCSDNNPKNPAPLDNRPALEKLAIAYEKVSENIPVSPAKMRPQARRRFLEDVFSQADFNYLATLNALSKISPQIVTQYHKDMKDLLFLAHKGFGLDNLPDIYNTEEKELVRVIAKNIK